MSQYGSFWRSMRVVAWSFLGIRNRRASQEDSARINPFHVIVAGLVGVLLLVLGLIVLVKWVLA